MKLGGGKKIQSKHARRFLKTLEFLDETIDPNSKILNLGAETPFVSVMKKQGYSVDCTKLETDLDLVYDDVLVDKYDVVTAFELLERLVSPFNILRNIKAPELVAVVPLKLWFKPAYWNNDDPWDCHFHEFEPKQFEMLLSKAGWEIQHGEFWKSTSNKISIKSLLRRFSYRYYIVHCTRKKH